jgi:hypothetical protein
MYVHNGWTRRTLPLPALFVLVLDALLPRMQDVGVKCYGGKYVRKVGAGAAACCIVCGSSRATQRTSIYPAALARC